MIIQMPTLKRPASIKYVLSGNGLTKEQVVSGNASTEMKIGHIIYRTAKI